MKQSDNYSILPVQTANNADQDELVRLFKEAEIRITNRALGKIAKIFKNIYTLDGLVKLLNPEFPNVNSKQFLHQLRTKAEGGERI